MAELETRKIVKIDPDKCNGCGLCIPNCAENAIEIIDGKAQLVADNLCDGLGNCLGTCPQDAITIEERPAEAYDEAAVEQHLRPSQPAQQPEACSCPSAMLRKLAPAADAPTEASAQRPSHLGHFPIQLTLVPESGAIWQDADVLLAADCVGFALPDFHEKLLRGGKTLAVACPKLDDGGSYIAKLTRIFKANNIKSVTVARMEVPCCMGLVQIAEQALKLAGRDDITINEKVVRINGTIES